MAKDCSDPEWGTTGDAWAHTRGGEEAYVEVTCLSIGSGGAVIEINPSWKASFQETVNGGTTIGISGDPDADWSVMCMDSSTDSVEIKICFTEEEEEPPQLCINYTEQGACEDHGCFWYEDSCHANPSGEEEVDVAEGSEFNWRGHAIKILNIVCGPVNYVEAAIDGITKHLTFDENASSLSWFMAAVFPGPILGGAVFIAVKSIAIGCVTAKLIIGNGGLSKNERDEITQTIINNWTYPDGTPPTQGDTDAANEQAYKEMLRHPDHDEALQKKVDGIFTAAEYTAFCIEWKETRTEEILIERYYTSIFDITVPSWAIAGDVEISGTAPRANQKLEIMIQKKWLGFDTFAKDTSLGEITSGDDNKYKTTVELKEFGAVTVYARVQKGWIADLLNPITTPKHDIYIITPFVILAAVVALALVYDKHKKGKFIGVFKKRRK